MRLSYSGLVCLPSKEDTVSSNLISRSTVNAFTKSFLLQLILDTRIGYLGSFLLYWKFSPDTYYVSGAWSVMSVGILDNDGGVYYNSYGCTSSRRAQEVVVLGLLSLLASSSTTSSTAFPTDVSLRTWIMQIWKIAGA